MAKKILYVDYWTVGIGEFLLYDPFLRKAGYETMLFHYGSFRDPNIAKEETINGLLCRDISWYGTRNLVKILRREKPDVLVMLNFGNILDRAMTRACWLLNIPTVYLMHGIRANNPEEAKEWLKWDERANFNVLRRIAKVPHYLLSLIPMYLRVCLAQDPLFVFRGHTYSYLFGMLLNPARTVLYPSGFPDTMATRTLVYSQKDREFFVNTLRFPADSVMVVGNPKLDDIGEYIRQGAGDKKAMMTGMGMNPDREYMLFLDSDGVEGGQKGFTHEVQKQFIADIAEMTWKAGYELIIKPHPSTNIKRFQGILDALPRKVGLTSGFTLAPLVYHAEVVLGQCSTTLQHAIALRKPLLIANWLHDIDQIDAYILNGGGLPCNTKEELYAYLADMDSTKRKTAQMNEAYIEKYLGPTDFQTVERVVEIITSLISDGWEAVATSDPLTGNVLPGAEGSK